MHPFPRSDELGKELWDPEREIADCLDVIAQAKHREGDAFRQSEFRETAKKNLLKRGEPTVGAPFESELAKVRRKWVASRLVEAGIERATHWGWPNTYTYTKAIGEQIIAKSGVPHTITRPACCETTIEYPFRGWNEGISTTVPFMYLAMKGQTHLPGGRDAILDLIPSDMVASGMILALLELLEGTQAPIYQLGAADVNPCSSARYGELGGLYKRKHWQRKGGNPLVSFVQSHFEPAVVSMDHIERVGAPAFARAARLFASALRLAPVPLAKPASRALEDVAAGQDRIADLLRLFAPFSGNTLGPFSCENVRSAFARLPAEYKRRDPLDARDDRLGRLLRRHPHAGDREVDPAGDGEADAPRAQAAPRAPDARVARRRDGRPPRARRRALVPRRGRPLLAHHVRGRAAAARRGRGAPRGCGRRPRRSRRARGEEPPRLGDRVFRDPPRGRGRRADGSGPRAGGVRQRRARVGRARRDPRRARARARRRARGRHDGRRARNLPRGRRDAAGARARRERSPRASSSRAARPAGPRA